MVKKKTDLKKLKLLVSIVPQGKKEVIMDLLNEYYDVNFSFSTTGRGTVPNELKNLLMIDASDRDVVFSFIRAEKTKDAILALEDKFKKFKLHQSIAFAIPLKSVIGMQNYLFLSNLGGEFLGK
ncbi:MAG: hypothetical protein J6W64_07330 [Bacilli bacterium]|nr:hypothetical protein [Bacilli bacterium]